MELLESFLQSGRKRALSFLTTINTSLPVYHNLPLHYRKALIRFQRNEEVVTAMCDKNLGVCVIDVRLLDELTLANLTVATHKRLGVSEAVTVRTFIRQIAHHVQGWVFFAHQTVDEI